MTVWQVSVFCVVREVRFYSFSNDKFLSGNVCNENTYCFMDRIS